MWIEPEPVLGGARDPDDDPILGTALAAEADYLVSGDEGLIGLGSYQGVQIGTPSRFLDILEGIGASTMMSAVPTDLHRSPHTNLV